MKTKHTPGPWELYPNIIDKDGVSYYQITTKDVLGIWLANIQVIRGSKQNEHEANARLIAAAPELLEALQKLHKAAWSNGCSALLSEELKQGMAAIKKATS